MALTKVTQHSLGNSAVTTAKLNLTTLSTGNTVITGNLTVNTGIISMPGTAGSNNNLALLLDADDTWLEQRKPDGTQVGRVGFNGYSTANAYYSDFDLYTRTNADASLTRRLYINGLTGAAPNVEFSNVNFILRGGNKVWDAGTAPGAILQVVSTIKTDTFSTSSTGDTAITGLSVSITPKSTSSKILIMYSVNYDSTRGNSGGGFRIFKNGSHLTGASGASSGSRYTVNADFGANANADQSGMHRTGQVVDNPATTSALTYAMYTYQDSGFTTHVNRARADGNEGDDGRFASTITVFEIAG